MWIKFYPFPFEEKKQRKQKKMVCTHSQEARISHITKIIHEAKKLKTKNTTSKTIQRKKKQTPHLKLIPISKPEQSID